MTTSELRDAVLRLLRRNGRMSAAEIGDRLQIGADAAQAAITSMERDGVIMGYSVVVDDDKVAHGAVRAIIEVEVQPERDSGFDLVAMAIARFPEVHSVYLVSGRYDLRLEVSGPSLQDVARFVASKLASQDGVRATATHFILKKYKEAGVELRDEIPYERLKIVP